MVKGRMHSSFCANDGPCWCKQEISIESGTVQTGPKLEFLDEIPNVPVQKQSNIYETVAQETDDKPKLVAPDWVDEFSIGDEVRLINKYAKNPRAPVGAVGKIVAFVMQGNRAVVMFPDYNCSPDVSLKMLKPYRQ